MATPTVTRLAERRRRLSSFMFIFYPSALRTPGLHVIEQFHVVNDIMTTALHARDLVLLDRLQHLLIPVVCRFFLKGSGAGVAVQTFAVVVGTIKFDFLGFGRSCNVLHIDMFQAAPF